MMDQNERSPIYRCAVQFCGYHGPHDHHLIYHKKGSYFYNFPIKPRSLLNKWMEACSLGEQIDKDETLNMFVCSSHFRSQDFKKKYFLKTYELKDGVWPTKKLGEVYMDPPVEEKRRFMDNFHGVFKFCPFQKKHHRFTDYDDEYQDRYEAIEDPEEEPMLTKKRKIAFNEKVLVRTYPIEKGNELKNLKNSKQKNETKSNQIEKTLSREEKRIMYGFHLCMI